MLLTLAIGDVVNLAARLQQNCSPRRALIDGATYEEAKRWVDARKKRDLATHDLVDVERERQLQALHERVSGGTDDAEVYFQIDRVHFEMNEFDDALSYFERALGMEPDNVPFKVAYAEAGSDG